MQPKNKAERRKAFLNFLFVFIIGVTLIVTTVFFSLQVPIKQNNQLVKQMDDIEREREFSQKFLAQSKEINNMLDSINTKTDHPEVLDGKITNNISELSSFVESNSIYDKGLYSLVIDILSDLQKSKKASREISAQNTNVSELNQRISDLTRENESLTNRNESLTSKIDNLKVQPNNK